MSDETLSKAMTVDLSSVVNDERMRLYKSTRFSEMPIYPLLVKGVIIEFLVDSGVSLSTLRPCDSPRVQKLTGKVSVTGYQNR